jgi:putative peptidoglycan lipid II flippase
MSGATLVSRITGFVRTWAMAFAIGATGLTSAYNLANTIPNMVFELLAGGIIASLFIPMYLEVKERDGSEASATFASHLMTLTVIVLGAISLLGTVVPQIFVWTQTFTPAARQSTGVITAANFFFAFFAVQIVVYGAGSILSGLLNAHREYLWPSLGPVFNNLVVVAVFFGFAWMTKGHVSTASMIWLAAGTTLGVIAMYAVQLPSLRRTGVRLRATLDLKDPDVRRLLILAIPTVIYVGTNLLAFSFRNAYTLAVSSAGIGVLTYAWIFAQLPYGIVAVSLATAVFTELAQASSQNDMPAFKRYFGSGIRATGVVMIPMSAMLFALAIPIVSLLRVGRFTSGAVEPVAQALQWWSVGLVFFAAMMFLLRTFYSLKDTRTPMIVNLLVTALQIALYVALTTGLAAWRGLGVNGIPIAESVAWAIRALALAVILRRKISGYDAGGVLRVYALMTVASAIGAGAAYFLAGWLAGFTSGVWGAIVQIAVAGTVGLAVAFALGLLFGVREVRAASSRLARSLRGRSS